MEEKIVLEWSYTPESYFEEKVMRSGNGYAMEIDNGRVTATLSTQTYLENTSILKQLDDELKALFAGAQVASHQSYTLSRYVMHRYHRDGTRSVTVAANVAVVKVT